MLSKMSAFDKFQDKKVSPKSCPLWFLFFTMKLLQPFTQVFMGSKETGWFTNTLIYLNPDTEHPEENSPFVLGFGKRHHNFASH